MPILELVPGNRTSLQSARRLVVVISVLIAIGAIGGVPAYVRPQLDELRHADVLVILGGPDYSRYPYGLELAKQGWAPNVVISNPNGATDRWLSKQCDTPNPRYTLYCFSPDPATTKGEGRELARLATEHGWRTAIVVTIRPHVSRARYILQRCFAGDLIMAASPGHISATRWVYQYVYQTAGFVRALVQPGC